MTGKSTIDMKSWKDHLINFVTTRSSQEILNVITNNPCVLITGPFGSGKTTIACYISSMLAKEGYETILVSNPEEITRCTYRNQRKLFIIDDIFGNYSTNIFDISERSQKYGASLNAVITKYDTVKILITCRTYIYLLNINSFEKLKTHISFMHKDLISETSGLDLDERRNMYKSYFKIEIPKSISDNILSLYHFFPVMCSSCNTDNVLEYFTYPVDIVSSEIDGMHKKSDIGYLALAVLVVMNNKVEVSHLSGSIYSEKTDFTLRDIFYESGFNQYPSKDMLYKTFMSLNEEFIKNDNTLFSFRCPELFEIVVKCIGGSFMESILKHSSSAFIKERLQLSTTQENNTPFLIRVPECIKDAFFRRLTSDMKNSFILDVLGNKLFESEDYRRMFISYLHKHVKTKTLVEVSTGSNVLHIVSSFGYLDFLKHFLTSDKCQGIVNKKNLKGETPLHLSCQNAYMKCVRCLVECKAYINETDSNKRTALHYACESGVEPIVNYLVRNNSSINKKCSKGMLPLHIACDNGNLNVVKCLVKNTTNINETDKTDKTPLQYSCKHATSGIAEILILKNAQVNKCDNQGYSPLHVACKYGNEEVVKLLVKHEAITNSKTKQGQTPLDIALENSRGTISNLLRQCETKI